MKSTLTAMYVLGIVTVLQLGYASAATTDDLIAKASSGPLTGAECNQLVEALKDATQQGKWPKVGPILQANRGQFDAAAACKGVVSYWAGQPEQLGKLSFYQLYGIWSAVDGLGARDASSRISSAWMNSTDQWKQYDNRQMFGLATCLNSTQTNEPTAALKSLAEVAWTNNLTKTNLTDRGQQRDYLRLARYLAPALSQERRNVVADQVLQWFGADATPAPESQPSQDPAISEAVTVIDTLVELGRTDKAAEAGLKWVKANDSWKKADPTLLLSLSQALQRASQTSEAWNVIAQWQATSQPAKLDSIGLSAAAIASYREAKTDADKQKARETALKAYTACLTEVAASPDPSKLSQVAVLLKSVELTGPGKDYPDFAPALANCLKQSDWTSKPLQYGVLGSLLKTPAERAAIAAVVTDDAGMVRQSVSKVMVNVYNTIDGNPDQWRKTIDAKLAAEGLQADQKASWLMARGYCLALTSGYGRAYQLDCLSKAMAAAESSAVKFEAAQEMASVYGQAGRPEIAITFLESIKGQFQADQQAQIGQLQDQIRAAAAAAKAQATTAAAQAELVLKQSRLDYYKRELAAAQRANDQKTIERLTGAIAQLQAELK